MYPLATILYVVISVYSVSYVYQGYDQEACVEAAAGLVNGDYSSWQYGAYCYIYQHQNGYVFFLSLLFRLFGIRNYSAIYLVNIVLYFGTVCLVRKMAAIRIESKGILLLIWMSMLFFYPAIGYTGFAYGTVPDWRCLPQSVSRAIT